MTLLFIGNFINVVQLKFQTISNKNKKNNAELDLCSHLLKQTLNLMYLIFDVKEQFCCVYWFD